MRGQAAHPNVEVLAEFRAGLIGGIRGRRLAAHVAACPECAATDAGLVAVSAALAAVPAPLMPEPVAARIGMALASEASARASAGVPLSATDRAAGTRARDSQREHARGDRRRGSPGSRRLRLLSPAILVPAAVCLLAAVGGGFLLSRPGSPSGSATASHAFHAPAMGTNRHAPPVQVVPEHISPTAVSGASSSNSASGSERVPVISSGTDYQQATLRSQVDAWLRKRPRVHTVASAALSGCALKVTGGVRPVFVDSARYQSRRAYVIATDLRAWVVGPGCTAASPDQITSVPLRVASAGTGISAP